MQLLAIIAIAVALKLDHLNLGKRERSPRRQAWTEEWESVSGELLFRIPEDFRPATHSAKRNRSFFSSTLTPSSGLVRLLSPSRASGRSPDAHACSQFI